MITINITGDNVEQVMTELRVLAGMSFRLPSDTIVHHVSALTPEEQQRALKNAEINKADDEAREKMQAERKTGKARKAKEEVAPATEKVAPSASPEDPDSPSPATDAPAADERKKFDSPDDQLDYETEVAPLVLKAVDTAGRDKVKSVLDQFGVTRASQIEPSRWPELVALLQDLG
jgi:chemotaxis response regulator CheB